MQQTTVRELLAYFKQYIITWLNIIAYERGVYPQTAFEERNSFNLRVPYNRHPSVQEWQLELVQDLLNDLTLGHLMALRLILAADNASECYTLDLREFRTIKPDFHDKEIVDVCIDDMVDQYRANLSAFISQIRTLRPPLDGIFPTMEVTAETKGLTLKEDWILDKRNEYIQENDNDNGNIKSMSSLRPLPIVECGPIVFYSSIEIKQASK